MYYLQYLGVQVKSIKFTKYFFFIVVNAAHSQQVATAGTKR